VRQSRTSLQQESVPRDGRCGQVGGAGEWVRNLDLFHRVRMYEVRRWPVRRIASLSSTPSAVAVGAQIVAMGLSVIKEATQPRLCVIADR